MSDACPSFRDFRRLASKDNVVPLYRAVVADLLSPVAAFLKLAPQTVNARRRGGSRTRPYSFLLESVEGGEHVGRYTFFGVDPFQVVTCRGRRITLRRGAERQEESGNIFDYLRQTGARYRPAAVPGLPPFTGGAVGYLAYETVRQLELLPPRVAPDVDVDDAVFMYFANLVAFDHVQHRLFLIANVLTEEGKGSLRAKYDAAVKQLDGMERRLARPLRFARHRPPRGPLRVSANMTRRNYEAQVRRAQRYIRAGDVFQVVLSQRFDLAARVPPFEVYRALRVVNPSPYLYYLQLGEATLLGSSPEMLVKVTGREVEYRPIAGTRPRGATEEEDLRLEQELKSDEKERAEHIMLVDLGRNDIGRVCEAGTVRVKELMAVERYSHVMHLVSRLSGLLREGSDGYAALAACFPAGTLSGAPKIRACEIIDELEPTRRGLYGGAVLYLDFSGNLNSCIVIRTALIKDRRAYVQAGAGIVADSVPRLEYDECVNKARAMLKAFETAEQARKQGL
ncbi:MAG TPA: anthranilate synthase component I [Terriglobia bacterium]|nr:anthranilate synthase component I [Terriglobia bacterium]